MGDLVVTSLLTAHPDPQRGHLWAADPAEVTVADSVAAHGHHLVVLHDCLDAPPPGPAEWVRVDGLAPNPYFGRWEAVAWLLARRDAERVWCVDASDVEMLADPFEHMTPGALHIGSEPTTVAAQRWVADHHPDHAEWAEANGDRVLLNPGLVGGPAGLVAEFAQAVADWWPTGDLTDVARANKVARDLPAGVVTGHPVHSPFRAYEATPGAWWRHK